MTVIYLFIGNSWGLDAETGQGCVGCGHQEQFYACADVAIGTSVLLRHPVHGDYVLNNTISGSHGDAVHTTAGARGTFISSCLLIYSLVIVYTV